ncbi:hypothetical protein SAMN04490370_101138 [Eubacterium ruminantium]|nr:hypothetical protein SAMN04490370_101138 [Eubacterium ruminantium]
MACGPEFGNSFCFVVYINLPEANKEENSE